MAKTYKYELHCHTKEVSQCGKISASECVRLYKEKGYDGLVITDHYSPLTFIYRLKNPFTPRKYDNFYLSGYRLAKQAAAGSDFTVLLGMELRFYSTINDYLIYGTAEDFFDTPGNFLSMYQKKAYELCKEKDLLFIQAHPFRQLRKPGRLQYLDGTEIFNYKDIGTDNNDAALRWAEENNIKIRLAGSDFHDIPQLAGSGIMTDVKISGNRELLDVLKSGNFEIIK